MKNFDKIKKYTEIKNITKIGQKHIFNFGIIYTLNKAGVNKKLRFGVLISKKFGNAVKRNKAKRRITACLNAIKPNSLLDVVFIPRNQIIELEFKIIAQKVQELLYS